MLPKAILAVPNTLDEADANLRQLVNFLGIDCEVIPINGVRKFVQTSGRSNRLCLMGSGESMFKVLRSYEEREGSTSSLFSATHSILVYGLDSSETSSQTVKHFLGPAFVSIDRFESDGYNFEIVSNRKDICGQLSGLSAGPINKEIDFGINLADDGESVSRLISVGGKGFFVRAKRTDCDIFCVACKGVSNIHNHVAVGPEVRGLDINRHFSQLVPVVMYLRYVFKDACWHINNNYGNVIIDDPLLKPNYGYLNYEKLLSVMDEKNFSTTIAFIPWNHRRTDTSVLKMFLNRNDRYSIAIHGCDHNRNEFGIHDSRELAGQSKLAKARMERHRQETGLGCPSIMIFPQGKFSNEALRVLKMNGYSSAVNSEIIPTDTGTNGIELSQVLSPAITKYSSFSLFGRRYPSDGIVNFAFDLFMGKPCLVVVHHDYFKKGYRELVDFIEQLNALDGNLQWKGLGQILSNVHLWKINSTGTIEVRMYANNFILTNDFCEKRSYVVYKEEVDFDRVGKVTVNANETYFTNDVSDTIRIECGIEAGEKADIVIHYNDPYKDLRVERKLGKRIRAFGRRYLTEVRDNFLSKNDMALRLASQIGKAIR